MRVLFAALFVFGSMLGSIGLLESHFPDQPYPWWAKFLPAVAMLFAMGISLVLFNRSGFRPHLRRKPIGEYIKELEAHQKLKRESYKAVRAFSVEEFEDEGSHYFLELADGRVLYLSGQYLYDYEPITDDPEFNQERSFPCTDFEVIRHKDAGYVLQILCSGSVLEPELTANPFTQENFKLEIPEDGQVIKNKSYEQIRAEWAAT